MKRIRKHQLTDILFTALCTVICGGESFQDMEEFGNAKKEWLRKYLERPNGIPSHDTFNRVFQLLEPLEFQNCLIGHWGAENQCHWVMDVLFKEDESRARSGHAAQNLGTTRGWALNLVRKENTHKRGIKGRLKRAGWDRLYLEQILQN